MGRHLCVPLVLALLLLGAGTLAWAQQETTSLPPPAQSETQQPVWSPQELDNLVAPIALYPDPLLGQMLVASTYPLEVVEANQWLQRNKNLSGRELMDAAKQQSWDPSVQALVAIPDALTELNRDISWTTELGNAFLAQQADVMNAVQRMRAQAQANGKLYSTPQQTVRTEEQGGQQAIVIQPANPQIIYVPYYDPVYVWGPPVYGYYPPLFYSGWGFGFGPGFNLGFCFDDWGGWGYWGWGPNWFGRSVFVNNYFFPRYGFYRGYGSGFGGRSIWVHNPGHRLGIPYGNRWVSDRFERASIASRNSFRAGTGRSGGTAPYSNYSAGRWAGRTLTQGYRNTAPQQYRNTVPQQRYQSPQQYRNTVPQQRYQAPQQNYRVQQYRSASQQQYRAAAPNFGSRSGPNSGGAGFSGRSGSVRGGNFGGGGHSSGHGGGGRR
jgi:uncharacterized membrane protein YgcG